MTPISIVGTVLFITKEGDLEYDLNLIYNSVYDKLILVILSDSNLNKR